MFVANGLAQKDPNSQPIPLYENYGIIQDTPAPEIDALAFANYGIFDVSSGSVPYDFQNVRHFTNSGSMQGYPGFRFDTAFTDRPRQPAEDFVNKATGTIVGSIWLLISATNIVNEGILTAGADGLVRLEGKTVNLRRSGLQVEPLGIDTGACRPMQSLPLVSSNEFTGDSSIIDAFADINTNGLAIDTIISLNPDGTVFVNAPQPVGTLPSAKAYVRTNAVTPTNFTVQAVFVQAHDPDVTFDVKFARSPAENNPPFLVPIVRMSTTESNIVTGQTLRKSIYLLDRLSAEKVVGAETNLVYYTNLAANTLVPSPLFVTRDAPCDYANARTTNALVTTNLFYDSSFSNTIVTNMNASYIARVLATASQPLAVPGATLSNLASRVEIRAENLDLTKTRMRADGIVRIQTDNLIASTNAVLAVANLTYDLNAREHPLLIKDLAVPQIRTFAGTISAWCGYWTNQTGSTVTNVGPDPNDPTITVTNVATNTIDVAYHALFVDNRISTVGIVSVNDLVLRSKEVIFSDKMTVNESFTVLSDTFTVAPEGNLRLPGVMLTGLGQGTGRGVDSLAGTNLPNLVILTNLGAIEAAGSINLGNDRPKPYQRIVNHGTLRAAGGQILQSQEFENTGEVYGGSSLSLVTQAGRLEGGTFTSEGDIRLTGLDLKLRNHKQSSSALYITITNSLSDSGGGANNSLACNAGFNLLIKPAYGALLGTKLSSTAPKYVSILHLWAAEDRGAVPEGFTNNAAVGRLSLDVGYDAALTFAGTGGSNAIYVDFLELSANITNDLAGTLDIRPGFVIYFADANVPVEQLDGQLNGKLRWVKDYSDGPNSSVDVLLRSGKTTHMNRALRLSSTLDSDGDGIPNGFDPYPLDPDPIPVGPVTVSSWVPLEATVPTKVVGNVVWQIEYATRLNEPDWQVYGRYTNYVPSNGSFLLSIPDPLPHGEQQRFYRVKLNL